MGMCPVSQGALPGRAPGWDFMPCCHCPEVLHHFLKRSPMFSSHPESCKFLGQSRDSHVRCSSKGCKCSGITHLGNHCPAYPYSWSFPPHTPTVETLEGPNFISVFPKFVWATQLLFLFLPKVTKPVIQPRWPTSVFSGNWRDSAVYPSKASLQPTLKC